MIQKNKNVLILTSLIILLPVVMGLILPGYSFNVWISVAMPVFMLATHWFGIFITARDKNNEEQSQNVLNSNRKEIPTYIFFKIRDWVAEESGATSF